MNCFVIRLLFSAVSLAPVLCWAAEPSTDQAEAIAIIQKLGGQVVVDENSPGKPVISVGLGERDVTDAGMEQFKRLTQLKELILSGTKVTDVGLKYLKGLPHLQSLSLDRTEVTDAGLERLVD